VDELLCLIDDARSARPPTDTDWQETIEHPSSRWRSAH
jgi:hypothetical protein